LLEGASLILFGLLKRDLAGGLVMVRRFIFGRIIGFLLTMDSNLLLLLVIHLILI